MCVVCAANPCVWCVPQTQAFIRVRDFSYIEVINRLARILLRNEMRISFKRLLSPCRLVVLFRSIEIGRRSPDHDDNVFLAEINAYHGTGCSECAVGVGAMGVGAVGVGAVGVCAVGVRVGVGAVARSC